MPSIQTISPAHLESSIQRIGEEIFQRATAAAPSIASMEFWQQTAMNWLTRDEDLKLRLFKFIEEMPSLTDRSQIAQRLKERLSRPENGHPGTSGLPGPLELAIAYRRCDSLYAGVVAELVRWGCSRSARQFICGATPEEAIASVVKLRRQGMAFTLDLLGETVHTADVARAHQETYLRLIRELAREAPSWPRVDVLDEAPWGPVHRVNISIKPTAIAAGIHASNGSALHSVLDHLRPILRAARDHGAFINIDMEHHAIKDLTLAVFKQALVEPEFRDWPGCGIVIQAYLRDSERDMAELIEWARSRGTPVTVRLVKGAYWDSEIATAESEGRLPPVYQEKRQSDASFERVAAMMLENSDAVRPAFGSHNVRSIAAGLAMEEALGLPRRTLELQMLYGMGDPLRRALVAMEHRVRVYCPFGDLVRGMAYLIRRLIENTSNESFLRQSFGGSTPVEGLLRNPANV